MKAARFAAVGLVVAAVAWIASGHLFPHETAESRAAIQTAEAEKPKLFRVSVMDVRVEPRSRNLVLSGRTEADRKMMVTARGDGTISELKVKRGQFVKQGDVIAVLSDEAREARVLQARAMLMQRKTELAAQHEAGRAGHLAEARSRQPRNAIQGRRSRARCRRSRARARRDARAVVGRGQRCAGRDRAGGVLDAGQGDRADRRARSDPRRGRGRRAPAASASSSASRRRSASSRATPRRARSASSPGPRAPRPAPTGSMSRSRMPTASSRTASPRRSPFRSRPFRRRACRARR